MKEIKNPSALMRPAPFWSWNDKLDKDECRRQIKEMAKQGWGSFFMHSRVGLVTPYLSEEWMDLCNVCCEEAEKEGLYAWLYDEDKWPSGFAGGIVPLNEDDRARELILLKEDEITLDDTVFMEYNNNGAKYFICRRIEPLGNAWFNGYAYVDLMSPKAVKAFLDSTHEKYKEACGDYFGNVIPGVFTDEPCYLFFGWGKLLTPWSEYLPDFFKKMNGYDIKDHVHKIFFDVEDYKKIRFDYYNACTALFRESFSKQYYDWCEKNGLKLTGHFMSEDQLWFQTQWAGDVMSHYEFMHWPGTDKLERHINQNATNKQCSTVCDQLDKERAFSEVFGCMGGQVSFFERKWMGDWQTILGINFVNHHLSLYSMRGERKRDFPANLFYQQPWWNEEKYMSDYFGRICAFASEGNRNLDLLVLQPLTSVWCEYSPLHIASGYAPEMIYDKPYEIISKRLMEEKLDYHFGNETIMEGHGKVEGNKIVIGKHSYSCIYVPPTSNLKANTYKLLKEFSANGGKIVFTQSLPTHIDGIETKMDFVNYEVGLNVEDSILILHKYSKHEITIEDNMLSRNITNVWDLKDGLKNNAKDIWCHSRQVGNTTRYMLANTNVKRECNVKITLPECENVALFDLFDGSFYKYDKNIIECTIAPAGSLLIVCGDEAKEATDTLPVAFGSGVLFEDLTKIMPVATVSEFKTKVLDQNTLLLNDVKLEMNGEVYEAPICSLWHTVFYPAKEGTPYTAEYKFDSKIDIKNCFVAIEVAENNEEIYFNGERVYAQKAYGEMGEMKPENSYLDVNFTKVLLPLIKTGENSIVIKGKKINNITGCGFHIRVETPMPEYHPTEVEEAYVVGDFSLEKVSESKYVIVEKKEPNNKNITDDGYPFYIGKVKLTADVDVPKKDKDYYLRLMDVDKSSVQVFVNGVDCGINIFKLDMFNITSALKSGKNTVEIVFATTLVNCFGPNRNATIKDSPGVGPNSFCDMNFFQDKYELFDYGVGEFSIYEF